jgi:hypothetical protein
MVDIDRLMILARLPNKRANRHNQSSRHDLPALGKQFVYFRVEVAQGGAGNQSLYLHNCGFMNLTGHHQNKPEIVYDSISFCSLAVIYHTKAIL